MARQLSIALAAAAIAALGSQAAAQEIHQPEFELTREVRRNADLARQAIGQNNFQAASGYLAQAASEATGDGDRYVISALQLDVANRTFDRNAQRAAIDALIANPLVSDDQRAMLYYHRGRLAYHAQDLVSARNALGAAIERGSTDPRTYVALASLETDRQNWPAALQLYEQAAAIMERAGERIPEAWYRRAIDLAQRIGNLPKATTFAQQLLAAYPTARNWRDVLSFYRKTANPEPAAALDSWRLQAATGALTGESDYRDYAQLANSAEQPGEIVRVVTAGRTANMLDGTNSEIATLMRNAERRADAARGRLEQRTAAANAAATGAEAVAVADDYLGFGNYAQAAVLYRLALEKGGVDAERVRSRLGMALALSGAGEEARTALDQVGGNWGAMARFWRIYADNAPPPPAAPAQPATGS